jgi:Zn-dependent metalloprotease
VAAFAERYGGNWHYQVNRLTGTYHHFYGSGIQLGAPLASEKEVEALARGFVRDNQPLFSIDNDNLKVTSCTHALGKWSIIFQQTHEGIRVWGGRVHLVFTETGRLFAFGSDAYPGIKISATPLLSEPDALAIAKGDIGFQEGLDKIDYRELMILPVEVGEAGLEYRLAYRFDLKVDEPYGIWATWIDANKGDILWRENHVRFTNFTGHSQGDVEWDSYCDGSTIDYPIKDMRITITGVGTTNTDQNGDFTLTYSGSDSKAISAEFRGPWVNVNRASGTDASQSGTITPGTPYTIDWSNTNSLASERDAFAYTTKIHDWIKGVDPAFTGLDYEMIAKIERRDLYCPGNAWWDGTNLNFCAQSSSYGNTARMADVVFHEYTHGITDYLYGANPVGADVQEANSDVGANLLTRESIMALGFYLDNCSSGIRNSQNTLQNPCSNEAHICGQVLAGFHWDSWQALLAAYPQAVADSVARSTWHFGRKLGLPATMTEQVYWTFVADDNDGNLNNGTPHYDQFCTGATNHGFACPEITVGVAITHTPLPNTSNTANPYPATAVITSTAGPIDLDSCRVNGGAFAGVSMAATGNPNEYVGYIPAQPACSEVKYYIYARDEAGNSKAHPVGAPASLHGFLVGYQTVFTDDFETNRGWTAGVTGDNATTGMWERCDPEGTEAQAEDDHTPTPGVNAYITQCAAGTGQWSYDVDGGKTTLLSPIFNLSSYTQATVSYYRWYSNDTGDSPGTDYWVVDVTNNGTTWVHLENTNLSDRSWALKQFNVGDYVSLTSQVRFRFIASDYDPGSLVEAGVDDFSLVACTRPSDTQPPAVAVLDPNGGERIIGGCGSSYLIRWHSSDNAGVTLTKILLSKDGGVTYPDTLVSGVLDSTWSWSVPDTNRPACRIKVVCFDAAMNVGSDQSDVNFEIVSAAAVPRDRSMPEEIVLSQNRPSPFDRVTEIEFGLPKSATISLRVYAVDGRLIATLARGIYAGGYHHVFWRGTDARGTEVSQGMYFYRLETGDKVLTRKMLRAK